MPFKTGDVVKVYSLQSFHGGGFLNGVEGIVSQDQFSEESSVLVAVERNIGGRKKIDPSYEVYPQQLRLVKSPKNKGMVKIFNTFLDELKSE